jgi:outer membrane receptor protein involved in Fe transport
MASAAALLGLLASPAPSPSATPPAPRFHDEVVVTAERGAERRSETPSAVSVTTREDVERLPVETLAELLDHVPGYRVLFGAGFGLLPMVSARGFFGGGEAEYVQLLVDGVPAADVESGLADWRRVRAADVERVEVLRGPASALYGDTALGGVVQVFPRTAGGAAFREAALSYGSFGTWAADGAYRSGGPRRLGIATTLGRTEGFRSRSAGTEAGADVALGHGADTRRWTLAVSGSWRDRDDPGPLSRAEAERDRSASDPLFVFDGEEVGRARAALTFRREGLRSPLRATLHSAVRWSDAVRTLLLAAGLGDRAHREVSTASVGGLLEAGRTFDLGGRDHVLRGGIEASQDRLETRYAAVDDGGVPGEVTGQASGRRDRLALFASMGWRAPGGVRLLAGARWDVIADAITDDPTAVADGRSTNSAWSPRIAASVNVTPRGHAPIAVFAQFSGAFKAATLDQLADPRPFPDFDGGTFRISNPQLSPQRARTWEAGLSQAAGGSRWEVVAYRTTVQDEIDFDPATFRYRNIGRSLHAGLELSVRLREGRRLSPQADYAWTRVEAIQEGRAGLQLKNVPEHLLRAGVRAELPAGLRASIRLSWAAGQFLDDANRLRADEAAVVDLRVERRFGPLRARFDALNLTGEAWEPVGYVLPDLSGGAIAYVLPAPGRAVRLGLEWRF